GVVPRTLHVDAPSSQVDWGAGAVEVAAESMEWPGTRGPRRAGVSAFGLSGTNAHVILEQGEEPVPEPETAPLPVLLSAASESALRAQAARLRSAPLSASGLGFALATARAALTHRAAIVGGDLDAGLAALASGEPAAEVVRGVAGRPRVAFVFAGQGSQRVGMGRELYERFPVFA
ncbi:ketoacyl-synthetase C-terminal extension domain-containing protein, partial [Actinoplanes couchii]